VRRSNNESGFSAIWVALCLLFLLAATALAVDVSGFYETARTDQTTADLACLAGIPSMPENPAVARASGAENAQRNFPSLAAATPSTSGNTLTMSDAFGNSVTITAPFGVDNNKMQVSVTETDQATFGRVIGASDVPITQVAYCKVFAGGSGSVPFAGMPGGWTGGLQAPNPCGTNSGNCGQLYIPNAAVGGNGGPVFEENVAEGVDRILTPGLYPGLVNCASTPPGASCNVVQTDPGVNAGTLGDGFLRRLSDTSGSSQTFTRSGNSYDADTVADILGSTPAALPARPAAWEDWIHGPWGTADVSNHKWWNDVIAKCDSPRLISFPIVSEEMDWSDTRYQAGDPYPQWPNGGSKDMRVIGIYTAILVNPNDANDFFGNGNLKNADSTIIWFGPNARCVGPDGSTTPFTTGSIKTYRLVDANA
jgi:Putative Flp pilus-assembly TadE/G-like